MMNPKELAEAHWSYVEQVLGAHDEDEEIIEKCKFHYISAFEHGYKHGVEDYSVPVVTQKKAIAWGEKDEMQRG